MDLGRSSYMFIDYDKLNNKNVKYIKMKEKRIPKAKPKKNTRDEMGSNCTV